MPGKHTEDGADRLLRVDRARIAQPVGDFGDKLAAVNAGIDKEGPFYLFALRLVPLFPFFIVNLLMGLTNIRTWTFYWVSQLGMLLGTGAYVLLGTELDEFRITPGLLATFALIGILPLIGAVV